MCAPTRVVVMGMIVRLNFENQGLRKRSTHRLNHDSFSMVILWSSRLLKKQDKSF
jgi:hypothetical protein